MPPPEPNIAWLFDTLAWLLRAQGGARFLQARRLVRPEDFPVQGPAGPALAARVLELVKRLAGLEHLPTTLARAESPVRSLAEAMGGVPLEAMSEPCPIEESLADDPDEAVILYQDDQLDDLSRLVAWFAHELGRVVVRRAGSEPPGAEAGPRVRELAADVAAVLFGFGLFMVGAAWRFERLTPVGPNALLGLGLGGGWRASVQGCLGQEDLAYALAVFCGLIDLDASEVLPFLGENARAYFQEAARDLDQRGDFLVRLRRLTMTGEGEESR